MTDQERPTEDSKRRKQQQTLAYLARAKENGATFYEVADYYNWPNKHGTGSGSLSNLHQEERICRLTKEYSRTNGQHLPCKVYVLPEFVGNRRTEGYGGKTGGQKHVGKMLERQRVVAFLKTYDMWDIAEQIESGDHEV